MSPVKKNPGQPDPGKRLTHWLLAATLALLALVLALQLWQLFQRGEAGEGGVPSGKAVEDQKSLSPGKAAMIEELQALNESLDAGALAELSAEELEQLWQAGAPGMPIGASAAAGAAERYAGTLEMDSITSSVDPELDETPAHYEVELQHITLGSFQYKVDAYSGQVLEGRANLFERIPSVEETGGEPDSDSPEEEPPVPLTGEEAALAAALAHAGVRQSEALGLGAQLDWEDGVQVYKIDFYAGGKEYEYEIEADTGAVRKAEEEWKDHPGLREEGFIGGEAAKQAALDHAGVPRAEAGYVEWELDEDEGVWVYEIEFRSGGVEYEYGIDASSGAVRKAEQDR